MSDTTNAPGLQASDLNNKVAGLPVWGWGVAIVGGLGVAYFFNSQATMDEAGPDTGDPYDVDAYGGQTAAYPYPGAGAVYVPGSPAQAVDTTRPVTNNEEWYRRAVDALVDLGYHGLSAARAIEKYLTSLALSDDERNLVDTAIRQIGIQPEQVGIPEEVESPDTNPPTTNPDTEPKKANKWRFDKRVPYRVRTTFSPWRVYVALKALGVSNIRNESGARVIGPGEISRGLKALGYKRYRNYRPTVTNVRRLLALRRARKGE